MNDLYFFFKTENILQLRELALKEVAFRVERKVENEIISGEKGCLLYTSAPACQYRIIYQMKLLWQVG